MNTDQYFAKARRNLTDDQCRSLCKLWTAAGGVVALMKNVIDGDCEPDHAFAMVSLLPSIFKATCEPIGNQAYEVFEQHVIKILDALDKFSQIDTQASNAFALGVSSVWIDSAMDIMANRNAETTNLESN